MLPRCAEALGHRPGWLPTTAPTDDRTENVAGQATLLKAGLCAARYWLAATPFQRRSGLGVGAAMSAAFGHLLEAQASLN